MGYDKCLQEERKGEQCIVGVLFQKLASARNLTKTREQAIRWPGKAARQVEARGPRRRRVGVNLEYGRSDRVWIPSTQGEDCGS